MSIEFALPTRYHHLVGERYPADCSALRHAGCVASPGGQEPTASARLAIAPHRSPLSRVQLPSLGSKRSCAVAGRPMAPIAPAG